MYKFMSKEFLDDWNKIFDKGEPVYVRTPEKEFIGNFVDDRGEGKVCVSVSSGKVEELVILDKLELIAMYSLYEVAVASLTDMKYPKHPEAYRLLFQVNGQFKDVEVHACSSENVFYYENLISETDHCYILKNFSMDDVEAAYMIEIGFATYEDEKRILDPAIVYKVSKTHPKLVKLLVRMKIHENLLMDIDGQQEMVTVCGLTETHLKVSFLKNDDGEAEVVDIPLEGINPDEWMVVFGAFYYT